MVDSLAAAALTRNWQLFDKSGLSNACPLSFPQPVLLLLVLVLLAFYRQAIILGFEIWLSVGTSEVHDVG